jgi:hypothetical protein
MGRAHEGVQISTSNPRDSRDGVWLGNDDSSPTMKATGGVGVAHKPGVTEILAGAVLPGRGGKRTGRLAGGSPVRAVDRSQPSDGSDRATARRSLMFGA